MERSRSAHSSSSSRGSSSTRETEEYFERVYVAVKKGIKEGKSTLLWLLQNTDRERKKIVITHVHIPANMIPLMGSKFPANEVNHQVVKEYRQHEWEKTHKLLDDYTTVCSELKVQAEKLVIEAEDAAKGLIELITLHGIVKLVMGAAADKQFSRRMKVPKSKTAITVRKQADPSCNIWFVCKGTLICTREALLGMSERTPPPTTTMNSLSSQSELLISRSMPLGHSESMRSDADLVHEHYLSRHRSKSNSFDSYGGEFIATLCHPFSVIDEMNNLSLLSIDEMNNSNHQIYKESLKRQKAERDVIEALRRAKTYEDLYAKEVNRRKEIEEELATEKLLVEMFKNQNSEILEQLQKTSKQKLELELRIADYDNIFKDLKEKLLEAQHLLSVLQGDCEKLHLQRDAALKELEKLRRNKEAVTTRRKGSINFTEFSFEEINRATCSFSNSLKIGEGGYGSVYIGFLRHTTVAIKVLDRKSMKGQLEFHQEVEVLSRIRHPNLVTLIGVCSQARALIYEFLPNGSLEDRLVCKNNTPPLTWQVRTRVASEICSSLIFLHSHKPQPVVHGDLSPKNILLDSNLVSKLGDFGICHRTDPKGTFVYMDPEFLSTGELTPSSDVYSFGVIVLRLLTGKPASEIVKKVKEALEKGVLDGIIDPTAGDWPFVQAKQLAHLGLRCCEVNRKNRPDLIGDVWRVLEPMMKITSLPVSLNLCGSVVEGNVPAPNYFICPIFQIFDSPEARLGRLITKTLRRS
ncbi:U-box domain-containing protein 33-like isoform X2 [Asparagus officinalis]|uniref:U-box domain-containing protein 33-like isoform X2 n=1 Tax=Asparagus officinalis TaxID=4686 RepID=UPI00098DF154|nr:U-box domain-containing protein 33-like isoform X2 [Asparagus officinalis]